MRTRRPALALAAVLLLAPAPAAVAGAVAAPAPSAADDSAQVTYRAPVDGEVWRGFEAPATAYGPGHRGADLAARPGQWVEAAGAGRVAHAGPVAGTTWVSIDHADGVRTAYGPLVGLAVARGDEVAAGQRLGRLAAGGHGHLGADEGLHVSARRDGVHIDPMSLFVAGGRPSLVGPGATRAHSPAVADHGAGPGGPRRDGDALRRLARPGPPLPVRGRRADRRHGGPPAAVPRGRSSVPRVPSPVPVDPRSGPVDGPTGVPLPSRPGSPDGGPVVTPITHVR